MKLKIWLIVGNVKIFLVEQGIFWEALKQYERIFWLIRNQQVWGSNPHAGSNEIKGLADVAGPIFIQG